MDRITVGSPAGQQDVVLRRWRDEDLTEGLVAREASALAAIRGRGVPAPELLAMDEDGTETGVRCTLTSALCRSAGPGAGGQAVVAGSACGHPGRDPRLSRPPADPVGRLVRRPAPAPALDGRPRPARCRPRGGLGAARRRAGAGARRLPALQRAVARRAAHRHRGLAERRDRQPGERRRPLPAQPGGAVRRRYGRGLSRGLSSVRPVSGWTDGPTCGRCCASTSSGRTSSRSRSPVGLGSTYQGCGSVSPPRCARAWTPWTSRRQSVVSIVGSAVG